LHLNDVLKGAGMQGLLTLRQNLGAVEKAEKALNDAGIHGGKIWLQVQAAKLKAIIAIEQAEGRSAKAEIQRLHQIENELKKFGVEVKNQVKSLAGMRQEMKQDVRQISLDMGAEF